MTVYTEQLLALPEVEEAAPVRHAAHHLVFFDFCRFVAAIGIVWVHTIGDTTFHTAISLGRIFNAFWAAAAVFMVFDIVARDPDRSYPAYVARRFHRLYIPFLAWTGVYLALHMVKGTALGVERAPAGFASLLWCGSSPHLYFLPFIFAVCVCMFPLARWTLQSNQNALAAAFIGVIGAAIWALGMVKPEHLVSREFYIGRNDYWLVNVWDIMPAVGLGVAIAVGYRLLPRTLTQSTATVLLGLAVAVSGTACIWISGYSVAAKCIGGAGFLLFAIAPWRGVRFERLARLGRLSFGIYLCHNLLAAFWRIIVSHHGIDGMPEARLTGFVFTAAMATLVAAMLDRHPRTRWLIGQS